MVRLDVSIGCRGRSDQYLCSLRTATRVGTDKGGALCSGRAYQNAS